MIVSFGDEMNGDWFPWSGIFMAARSEFPASPTKWEGPELFKRAYRYVVDRVRARGAHNIQWMFHTNNFSFPLDTLESRARLLSRVPSMSTGSA